MAFPSNAVIDTLQGASVGANWTLNPFHQTRVAAVPDTGVGWKTGTDTFDYYWNAASYGPNLEVYVEVTNPTGSETTYLYARTKEESDLVSTGDGYVFACRSGATCTMYRFDNAAVGSTIGSHTASSSVTGFGLLVTGTGADVTLAVYELISGAWSLKTTYTDSSAGRYTAAGHIGFLGSDAAHTVRWRNFGGGTVTPAAVIQRAGARAVRGLYAR